MKTKHPIKVAGELFPAGTEVRPATMEEMQAIWPGIKAKRGSAQVGVVFPGRSTPTVVDTSQLVSVKVCGDRSVPWQGGDPIRCTLEPGHRGKHRGLSPCGEYNCEWTWGRHQTCHMLAKPVTANSLQALK